MGGATPRQVETFLELPTQRFNVWIKHGLFPNRESVGRGNAREYSLQDVVVARIARELMDLTRARRFEIVNPEQLHWLVHDSLLYRETKIVRINRKITPEKTVALMKDMLADRVKGPVEFFDTITVTHNRKKDSFHFSWHSAADIPERVHDLVRIVIPVGAIIEEVRAFFKREGIDA